MSKRVSVTILLCEDEAHERFVKAYMKHCGLSTRAPTLKSFVASRLQYGGNVHWVMNKFPEQLHACRQRQKRAETLLIVVIDADDCAVEERRRDLLARLEAAGFDPFESHEPAVLFFPKRHIETWICALLGESVDEDENCKSRNKPGKEEFRRAAEVLFQWSRPNATPGSTCVPSLEASLPDWNRIG